MRPDRRTGAVATFCLTVLTGVATRAQGAPDNCFQAPRPECVVTAMRPLPATEAEFAGLQARIGGDPEGGATLFLYAFMVALGDEALGQALLGRTLAPGARDEARDSSQYGDQIDNSAERADFGQK